MAGLVPAIHVFTFHEHSKTWMPGHGDDVAMTEHLTLPAAA